MTPSPATPPRLIGALLAAGALGGFSLRAAPPDPVTVNARLTEWKVELSTVTVAAVSALARTGSSGIFVASLAKQYSDSGCSVFIW